MSTRRLIVNVDHVATVRQARRIQEPDPVAAATLALLGGADGIVVHRREDRRHIQDRDVHLLRQTVHAGFCLELAATPEMLKIALEVHPDAVTLVPERREELTTEAGLNVHEELAAVSEMVRTEQMEKVSVKAEANADERLLDLLLPLPEKKEVTESETGIVEEQKTTREKFRNKLKQGTLEDRMVEIKIQEKPVVMQGIIAGIEEIGVDFQNVIEKMIPQRSQVKKVPISEARKILKQEEAEKLVDKEKVIKEALYSAENMGIIFIDELDKIASRESGHGPDISREGVQRDILPIVEGSTVITRYGMVKTDRILFIAAGAFHVSKPSDLIPELQGRFPIRVELKDLGKEEFIRILTEPKNALIKQYTELLKTEGVKLQFEKDAIDEITDIAVKINRRGQSIGARRLHTVMEKLLEDDSFDAPELNGKDIVVDAKYVREKMKDIVKDEDLTKYIL